jgi:hypothetical protein
MTKSEFENVAGAFRLLQTAYRRNQVRVEKSADVLASPSD